MISDISTLTLWASFWDQLSVWSALAVFAGVLAESVADFDTLAKWTRLDQRPKLRSSVSKAGLLVLISALAIEVIGAIGSHDINEQIIATLNKELEATIEHDLQLTKFTKSLGLSNENLSRANKAQADALARERADIGGLTSRTAIVDKAIKAQRERDDRALAVLKDDSQKLEAARSDAISNAGKAADAARVANKAQADMTTALNDVQNMRARMQEIITPRVIDDAHFAALVAALKPFAKTQVDVAITRDPECSDLLARVTDALLAANWNIVPWSGAGFTLNLSTRPNLPAIGEVTGRGIQISVSETDREKLKAPVLALAQSLATAGLQLSIQAISDKTADGKANPNAVKAGIVHVVIGAKP